MDPSLALQLVLFIYLVVYTWQLWEGTHFEPKRGHVHLGHIERRFWYKRKKLKKKRAEQPSEEKNRDREENTPLLGKRERESSAEVFLPSLRPFWRASWGGEEERTRRTISSHLEFFFFLLFLDLVYGFHLLLNNGWHFSTCFCNLEHELNFFS